MAEPSLSTRQAVHEAGHAVIARSYGIPVASVTLSPDWNGVTFGDGQSNAQQMVRVWMAGDASVRAFFGEGYAGEGVKSDLPNATEQALRVTEGDRVAADAYVERALRQVRDDIRASGDLVAKIRAVALALEGRLDGAAVDEAIRSAVQVTGDGRTRGQPDPRCR